MVPEEKLSAVEQQRVDAGKVNAAREKEALKTTGPVVRNYDHTTGKTSTTAVKADEPQKLGKEESPPESSTAKS